MSKLEISESKLDKSVERTFLSGKNMKIYNFTEETNKNNDKNNYKNFMHSKTIKKPSIETYPINLNGNQVIFNLFSH